MSRAHRTRPYATESSTFIAASPERVRARIGAAETWPEWQSEILATERPEWTEAHEVVHGKARLLGFDVHGRSLSVLSEPSLVEQDVVVGVRMRVRYSIQERPSGCVVTHQLDADLPGGIAGRLLSALLWRRLRKMQRDLLERLRTQLDEEFP